jgi:mannose-6-phosphate isomerase-like protein (cupin superfamily)
MDSCRLDDVLASFDEHWEPRLVATVNDHDVKVAKIKGEFIWHAHPNSDELFLVLDGELTIELRDGEVALGPRDMYVVPKGVEHRPVATVETSIMMVELQGTVNTGDAGGDRTFEPVDLT